MGLIALVAAVVFAAAPVMPAPASPTPTAVATPIPIPNPTPAAPGAGPMMSPTAMYIHVGDSFDSGYGATACGFNGNGVGTCDVDKVMAYYRLSLQYDESLDCISYTGTHGSECGDGHPVWFGSLYTDFATKSFFTAQQNPNAWIVIEGGIHDAAMAESVDPTVFGVFQPQLDSIVAAFATTTPFDHIILIDTDYAPNDPATDVTIARLNGYVNAVALKYHTRVADFYDPTKACASTCFGPDGTHPSDAGYAVMARAIENAPIVR